MIAARLFSFILRGLEFVTSVIVLGITSFFIHYRNNYGYTPRKREIYTEVIATFSVIASIVLLIPTRGSFLHAGVDLFFSFALFAAFGSLYEWYGNVDCSNQGYRLAKFGFRGHSRAKCETWKTDEAFAFIAASLWLMSAFLSSTVGRKHDGVATDQPANGNGTHTKRSIFSRKPRSTV